MVWPDDVRDTTTAVYWVQGPTLYADLRQPTDMPDFRGVRGLKGLKPAHLRWMARQEAFAGRLAFDGDSFEWIRLINLHPRAALPDAGRLRFDGEILVEEGRDSPYYEHWHRVTAPDVRASAALLKDAASDRLGLLVRAGEAFIFARDRGETLMDLTTLEDALAGCADERAARDLMDCEVSFGSIGARGWRIERSSLPFREGHRLDPVEAADGADLMTEDVDGDGRATRRRWAIVESEGDLSDLVRRRSHAA